MKEVWKPIIGYEGLYEISNYGRIKSFIKHNGTNERILKLIKSKRGYFYIFLSKNGKREHFYVHILVLEAFIGLRPLNMECRHLDGNPSNNKSNNLLWGTHFENMQDRIRHGRYYTGNQKGINNPSSKINDWIIRIIRRLLEQGDLYQREIAKIFGVDQSLISYIKNKKIWKHIN